MDKPDPETVHIHVPSFIGTLPPPPAYIDTEETGDGPPPTVSTPVECSDSQAPTPSACRSRMYSIGVCMLLFGVLVIGTVLTFYLLPVTCSVHGCTGENDTLLCCVAIDGNSSHYSCNAEPVRGNETGCAAWRSAPMVSPIECDSWGCDSGGVTTGSHRTDYKAYTDGSFDKGDMTAMFIVSAEIVAAGALFGCMGSRVSNCMWRK